MNLQAASRTRAGDRAAIPGLAQFAAGIQGQVIQAQDTAYETARRVWNGMIDRYPALIVRCAGPADVRRAVDFARRRDLLVAIRGGGHNVAGNGTCDDGMVLDLGPMKTIELDPVRRTVRAEPGLTWGEIDRATQAAGLALPGGIQSTTGIAGFTLGGGFGYLSRLHGLTCDHLLAAEVITADGVALTASASDNPDLFWGLRGGGGNFGIVTAFTYHLVPLGPVLGGMLIHSATRAGEVLRFYREFAAAAPPALASVLIFTTAPVAPHIPVHLHGRPVLLVTLCYAGPPDEGERVIQPLRAFGPPDADLVSIRPYTEVQTLLDAANPAGLLNYWKAEYIQGYGDEAIETILHYTAQAPSPNSKLLLNQLGGAISHVPPDATAYAHRAAPFIANINAMWAAPAASESAIAWARDFWTALQPFSAGGVYVNFLSNEGEDRVRAAYEPGTYARLATLKQKYDPTNFFRLNQNIKPTG
ncbi:MAG TPA: FAD-binding oxidoreductase [Chloroflexia bacterium]|nr:FAD-binding oxidoreductase [Chloroflexia bacterium]